MTGHHSELLFPLIVSGENGRIDPVPTLSAVLEHAPMAVAVLEGSQLIHRWSNARWALRLPGGMDPSALVGKPLRSVLPEGEGELVAFALRAMQTGEAQVFTDLHVHGVHGEMRLRGVAQPHAGRVILQVHGEPRHQRAVRPADIADQVLEQIPHPVVVLSRAGEVLRANNKARTRFGVEIGQSGTAILAATDLRDDRGQPIAAARAVEIGRALRGETVEMRGSARDRLLGQRRDCIIHGGPVIEDGAVVAGLLISIDVTDLRRLDRAKDEFLNIAAHELKTPLTAVRAYLQLAQRRGAADPRVGQLIHNAVQGTYRMQRLIADMLDTARLESGRLRLQLERCDLARIVLDVEERFRRDLTEGQSITVQVEAPLLLDGDPVRLDQMIGNLLSNALRHGPPGRPVRLSARKENNVAIVEVADEGEGIPPEFVPHLFERLARGKTAKGDGLGLGLFLARNLARLHHGDITVDPGCGRGARFSLKLPLAD
jgi:signal transduction histidine kinase